MKEVWNIAAVIPMEKGLGNGVSRSEKSNGKGNSGYCEELLPEENFLGVCNQELLARGSELLKRTRNGRFVLNYNISSKLLPEILRICFMLLQVISTGKSYLFIYIELVR